MNLFRKNQKIIAAIICIIVIVAMIVPLLSSIVTL